MSLTSGRCLFLRPCDPRGIIGRPAHQRIALRHPRIARTMFSLGLSVPGRRAHQRSGLRRRRMARTMFGLGLSVPGRRAGTSFVLYGMRDSDAAFNRGDLEAALGAPAPEVDSPPPPIFPGAETLDGSEAV